MSTPIPMDSKYRELSDLISDLRKSILEDRDFHKVFKYPRATYVGLVKLNNMIGMDFLKTVINRMLNKYIVYIIDDIHEDEEDNSLHNILLVGPPATGKSSVAEVIGYIMSASGIIEEPTAEVLASLGEKEKKSVVTNTEPNKILPLGQANIPETPEELIRNISNLYKDKMLRVTQGITKLSAKLRIVAEQARASDVQLIELTLQVQDLQEYVKDPSGKEKLDSIYAKVKQIHKALDTICGASALHSAIPIVPISIVEESIRVVEQSKIQSDEIIPESDFEPKYISVNARNLIGEFVGHTRPTIVKLISRSLGSVLFIDEAYALNSVQNGEVEGFSKEAINILCSYISKYCRYIIVIAAGYVKEMNEMLDINPGMRRRFPNVCSIEPYTIEQTVGIFRHQLYKAGLILDESINILLYLESNSKTIDTTTGADTLELTSKLSTIYADFRMRELNQSKIHHQSLCAKRSVEGKRITGTRKGTVNVEMLDVAVSELEKKKTIMDRGSYTPNPYMYT